MQTGHLPASRGSASLAGFRKGLRVIEGQNVAMIESSARSRLCARPRAAGGC